MTDTAQSFTTLPVCAQIGPDDNPEIFSDALKTVLSNEEILGFQSLCALIPRAADKVFGERIDAAPGLVAALPTVRRLIALARRLDHRLCVTFVGSGTGYVPLWLASEGLPVEVYEPDAERADWLTALASYFFDNPKISQAGKNQTTGQLTVRPLRGLGDLPADAPAADIVWITGLERYDIDAKQSAALMRWARRRVIASIEGAIVCLLRSDQIDLLADLQTAAATAHLKKIEENKFVVFRPFEIINSECPVELKNNLPPTNGSSDGFSFADIFSATGRTDRTITGHGHQIIRFSDGWDGYAP